MTTQSDNVNELATALAKAQSQLNPASKNSTNPHFRSKYADLQSIWSAANVVLEPNGLAVTQGFDAGNGETVTVWTLLLHKSGQWVRSSLTLKPVKADPQGIGSACTYGKRYGLAAILGIVADEDDDGNGASGHQKPQDGHVEPPPTSRPAQEQRPSTGSGTPTPHGWRAMRVPKFIKAHAGKTLAEMPEKDLLWWAGNYQPKPYNGAISESDILFRAALTEAQEELTSDRPL